jgi:putative transposase
MPNYRRVWVPGGTYFFTVNLLERRRTLLVDNIDALRAAFRSAQLARRFSMIAIVVLPDHLHCIWRLPEGDCDNATRWRHIKTLFSQSLPRDERRSRERMRRKKKGDGVIIRLNRPMPFPAHQTYRRIYAVALVGARQREG